MSGYTKEGIPRRRDAEMTGANKVRAQIDSLDLATLRPVSRLGEWQAFCTELMQEGMFYTDTTRHCMFVHPKTWKTLSYSHGAQAHLFRTAYSGAGGMKFLVMDSGPYGEAARLEARATPIATTMSDLQILEDQAQRLIVQAAGVNGAASQLQTQVFMQRYSELNGRVEEYAARLEHVRRLVALAGETVIESTS